MFVLDASVATAWCLKDETDPYPPRVLREINREKALVAPLWPQELANALLVAERRGRLKPAETSASLAKIRTLPITIEPSGVETSVDRAMELARQYQLTVYDATYLEIAIRENLPIATLDIELRRAAREVGVALFLES